MFLVRNRSEREQDSLAGSGIAVGLAVAVVLAVAAYIGYLIVSGHLPAVVSRS